MKRIAFIFLLAASAHGDWSSAWPASNTWQVASPVCYTGGVRVAMYSQVFTSTASGTINIFTVNWPCDTIISRTNTHLISSCATTNFMATNLCFQAVDSWLADTTLAAGERDCASIGTTNPVWFSQRLGYPQNNVSKLSAVKSWILSGTTNFCPPSLADSNGDYSAYCAIPETNWTWVVRSGLWWNGSAIYTETNHWIQSVSYVKPPTFSSVLFVGTNRVRGVYNPYAVTTGDESERNVCELLGLPRGYISVIVTNWDDAAPGWFAGNIYSNTINKVAFLTTNQVFYGSFFQLSPENNFIGTNSGFGHIVTNNWQFYNTWITWQTNGSTSLTNVITNALLIAGNTLLNASVPYYSNGWSSISIVASNTAFYTEQITGITNWLTTNIVGAVTNVLITTNTSSVALGVGYTSTTGTNTITNSLLSVTFTNSANLTNASQAFTNYDIAAGYHEIDYGWDGVKKCLDNFIYLQVPLDTFYSQSTGGVSACRYSNTGFESNKLYLTASEYSTISGTTNVNTSAISGVTASFTNSIGGGAFNGGSSYANRTAEIEILVDYIRVIAVETRTTTHYNYNFACVLQSTSTTSEVITNMDYTDHWWTGEVPFDYAYSCTTNTYASCGIASSLTSDFTMSHSVSNASVWSSDGWAYSQKWGYLPPLTSVRVRADVGCYQQTVPGLYDNLAKEFTSMRDIYANADSAYSYSGGLNPVVLPVPAQTNFQQRVLSWQADWIQTNLNDNSGFSWGTGGISGSYTGACGEQLTGYSTIYVAIVAREFNGIYIEQYQQTYPTIEWKYTTSQGGYTNITVNKIDYTTSPNWSRNDVKLWDGINNIGIFQRIGVSQISASHTLHDTQWESTSLQGSQPITDDAPAYFWNILPSVGIIKFNGGGGFNYK